MLYFKFEGKWYSVSTELYLELKYVLFPDGRYGKIGVLGFIEHGIMTGIEDWTIPFEEIAKVFYCAPAIEIPLPPG